MCKCKEDARVIVSLNLCTSVVLSASSVSINFLWVHRWNPLIHSGRETLSLSSLCCVWARPFSHDWQTSIWTARIKPINHIKLGDKKKKERERKKKNRSSKFNWEHREKIEVKKYRRPLPGYRAVGKWGLAGFSFRRLHKFISNDCRSEISVRLL